MPRSPSLRARRALVVALLAAVSVATLATDVAASALAVTLSAAGATTPAGVGRGHGHRRWWVRSRSTCWWEGDAQDLDDVEFRSYFRMEWSAFYGLADDLKPDLERSTTRFRTAIDYETVLAMGLYRLATGAAGVYVGRLAAACDGGSE